MNALVLALFVSMVALASAKPSGIYDGHLGYAHVGHVAHAVPAGPITLVGASGVVTPNGAAGPSGVVNGHGAVGPDGIHNAHDHGYIAAAPVAVHGLGYAHGAAVVAPAAHAAVVGPVAHTAVVGPVAHAAVVGPVAHATVVGAHGLGYGLDHGLHGLHGVHGYGHW